VILADTSAWIAYQRDVDSPASAAVRDAIRSDSIATTDAVLLELLAGMASDRVEAWTGLLARAEHLAQLPWDDAITAAGIYRDCRRNGYTPRSLVDCLIAAVAIRHDVRLLHDDRDFDAIARHTALRVLRA
jgi:predicted nucleic acid-binding protein